MDSRTHVMLAAHLLRLTGGDKGLSIVSLFPQVDRNPPTLHRLYAHTVFRAREITLMGLVHFLGAGHVAGVERYKNDFVAQRFQAEAGRILSYAQGPVWSKEVAQKQVPHAIMAYISHLYLDTYNQPTQPFAPYSLMCSGQWELWAALGDFRHALYTTTIIDALRDELVTDSLWQVEPVFDPDAMIHAMLIRMATLGRQESWLDTETVFASLGLALPAMEASSACLVFLQQFEQRLNALHRKHLGDFRPIVPVLERESDEALA